MSFFKHLRKWAVFIFSLFFLVVGVFFIVIGAIYIEKFSNLSEAFPPSYSYFKAIPILTIIVGSIIFIISIFGAFGVYTKNSWLLTAYATILLTIFILQIALALFIFVEVSRKDDLAIKVNKTLDDLFRKPQNPQLIDLIQEDFKCCGTYGPKFWKDTGMEDRTKTCHTEHNSKGSLYQDGCQDKFYKSLLCIVSTIGITVLALSTVQVIGATFSLGLANHIRNQKRRYRNY